MLRHFSFERIFAKKVLLAATGVAVVSGATVFSFINVPDSIARPAQTSTAPLPSFEVASIKSHAPGDNMSRLGGPDVSRFSAINVSVKSLIEFAYHVEDFQVSGGTGWIAYDKFDVDAKVEDSLAEQIQKLPAAQQSDQLKLMVQSLPSIASNLVSLIR